MRPKVIVDTSVWIEYFRRSDSEEKGEVDSLLENKRAILVGIVLAELLQGTRNEREFDLLYSSLGALPFCAASLDTWVRAARLSHLLRRQGIAIPLSDSLIGALALENGYLVYTLDPHFEQIENLKLYQPESSQQTKS